MLCSSAEHHGFGCADIYHAFNGLDATKPSGDLFSADYTHLSDPATHASPVYARPGVPPPGLISSAAARSSAYLLH